MDHLRRFSYLFVGFTVHDAGYSLAATIGACLLSILIYVVYAMLAAYLGSRTGQTHSLPDEVDLRLERLLAGVVVPRGRPARLGRLPGRADGADLEWSVRMDGGRAADDYLRREVNPLLDLATGVTSYLGAHIVLEFLGRICEQPRWIKRFDEWASRRAARERGAATVSG